MSFIMSGLGEPSKYKTIKLGKFHPHLTMQSKANKVMPSLAPATAEMGLRLRLTYILPSQTGTSKTRVMKFCMWPSFIKRIRLHPLNNSSLTLMIYLGVASIFFQKGVVLGF